MRTSLSIASLATVAIASSAAAQSGPMSVFNYGHVDLSYTQSDYSGFDLNILAFTGYGDFSSGAIFGSVGAISQRFESGGSEETRTNAELLLGYNFGDFGVYGLYQRRAFGGSGRTFVDNTYGLGGVYNGQGFEVGIEVTDGEDGDEQATLLYAGTDTIPDLYVFGALAMFEQQDGTSYILGAEYDTDVSRTLGVMVGESDSDFTRFFIETEYLFTPDIKGTASIAAVVGEGEYLGQWAIGGGYMVADQLWLEASYGEAFQTFPAPEVNNISIGLTYEFGGDPSARTRLREAVQELEEGAVFEIR